MNKIVKLVLIFVAILGSVVAVLLVNGGGGEGIPEFTDSRLTDLQTAIENGWKERTDWDKDFYVNNHKKIQVLKADFSVTTLQNFNSSQAVTIAHKKIFEHWSSVSCKKSNVDMYINAINTICTYDNRAKNIPQVNEVYAVYNVYKDALALATSPFLPKSGFNGTTWKSYDSYMESQKNAIRTVMSKPYYRNISHIAVIKNGLNAANGKMAAARIKYYEKLANEIIAYYDRKPRTVDNLSALRSVRNQFIAEYPNNSSVINFVYRFSDEIESGY